MKNIEPETSSARERVLHTAEHLFHQHGYNAVSMRDLARSLDMKQASLYYHAPQGKEQLFAEVTERSLHRHRLGIEEAIAAAGPDVQDQFEAVADWLLSQPAMNLFAMFTADMPALSEETAVHLTRTAHEALFVPLIQLLEEAQAAGKIRPIPSDQVAASFLTIMDGIFFANRARFTHIPMRQMAHNMIDMMLNGLRPSTQGGTPNA